MNHTASGYLVAAGIGSLALCGACLLTTPNTIGGQRRRSRASTGLMVLALALVIASNVVAR